MPFQIDEEELQPVDKVVVYAVMGVQKFTEKQDLNGMKKVYGVIPVFDNVADAQAAAKKGLSGFQIQKVDMYNG